MDKQSARARKTRQSSGYAMQQLSTCTLCKHASRVCNNRCRLASQGLQKHSWNAGQTQQQKRAGGERAHQMQTNRKGTSSGAGHDNDSQHSTWGRQNAEDANKQTNKQTNKQELRGWPRHAIILQWLEEGGAKPLTSLPEPSSAVQHLRTVNH